MKYHVNRIQNINEYNFLNKQGWQYIWLWVLFSILIGNLFRDSLHEYVPSFIQYYFANYINLATNANMFLSVLLAFILIMPIFCFLILKKGMNNFELTRNSRSVLGIFIAGSFYINSPAVDYVDRTRYSGFVYQLIISDGWLGATAACLFFSLMFVVSLLILLKERIRKVVTND